MQNFEQENVQQLGSYFKILTELQRFKAFKMSNLELTSKSVLFTSKKSKKTQNAGLNLSTPRKSKSYGHLDFDIFRKLMHRRTFLYPLLSTYLQPSGQQ